MKLNKLFLLAGIATLGFAMSACSDDDDYTPGAPVSGDCPALSFVAEETGKSVELDPADPTEVTFTVTREKGDAAASYKLTQLSNTDGIFEVPATVEFAAGEKEATVKATFNKADVGKTYALEVALDDEVINPYKAATKKTFTYQFVRVKWNSLGKGQWINTFLYGTFWAEVEIQQRDDKPAMFRVENIYTDDFVSSAGAAPSGYQPWYVFSVTKTGNVVWDEWFSINTVHPSYGAEVKCYLPSALNASFAGDDAQSKCYTDKEGNILYFNLMPYTYMDGIGGWGLQQYLVAFPGFDLAGKLGI